MESTYSYLTLEMPLWALIYRAEAWGQLLKGQIIFKKPNDESLFSFSVQVCPHHNQIETWVKTVGANAARISISRIWCSVRTLTKAIDEISYFHQKETKQLILLCN